MHYLWATRVSEVLPFLFDSLWHRIIGAIFTVVTFSSAGGTGSGGICFRAVQLGLGTIRSALLFLVTSPMNWLYQKSASSLL